MKKLFSFIISVIFFFSYSNLHAQELIDVLSYTIGNDIEETEKILKDNDVNYILHEKTKKTITISIIDNDAAYLCRFRTNCESNLVKNSVCEVKLNLRHDDINHLKLLQLLRQNTKVYSAKTGVYSTDILITFNSKM